jgi:hypothetical protein
MVRRLQVGMLGLNTTNKQIESSEKVLLQSVDALNTNRRVVEIFYVDSFEATEQLQAGARAVEVHPPRQGTPAEPHCLPKRW